MIVRNFLMNTSHFQKFTYENDGHVLYCCLTPKELFMMLIPFRQQSTQIDYYFTRNFNFRNFMFSDNDQLIHVFQNYQLMFQYLRNLSQMKCIKLQNGYFQFHAQGFEIPYKIILSKVVSTISQAGLIYMLKTNQNKSQISQQNKNKKNLMKEPFYQFKRQSSYAENQMLIQYSQVSKKVKTQTNEQLGRIIILSSQDQTTNQNQNQINNQALNNSSFDMKNQINLKEYDQMFQKMKNQKEQLERILNNLKSLTKKCKQIIPQSLQPKQSELIDRQSFQLIQKIMQQQQEENKQNSNQEQSNRSIRAEIVAPILQSIQRQAKKCMICLSELLPEQNKTYLICFHDFHTNCIQNWLQIKNKCPICQVSQNSQQEISDNDDSSSDDQQDQDQEGQEVSSEEQVRLNNQQNRQNISQNSNNAQNSRRSGNTNRNSRSNINLRNSRSRNLQQSSTRSLNPSRQRLIRQRINRRSIVNESPSPQVDNNQRNRTANNRYISSDSNLSSRSRKPRTGSSSRRR